MDNMTDAEKNEWAKKRNGIGATILPPLMYDLFESNGYDMRWYIRSMPIPTNTSLDLCNGAKPHNHIE